MKIIGLSGTNGSGKDTVAKLLTDKHGYYVASATDMLAEELHRRGLPTDRKHKAELSAEWRRQYGMASIVDRAYEYYRAHEQEYKGMIVGSLRHPGEAERIHELRGTMLWVDADPKIRYDRIQKADRGRHHEDNKTFEEFLAEEEREMHPVGDHATLNMSAVRDQADIVLLNETTVEDFEKAIVSALGL
jgi:dephospho-CoA kinase